MDIFHPHHQFLGFAWDFEGVTRYFTFVVLALPSFFALYLGDGG